MSPDHWRLAAWYAAYFAFIGGFSSYYSLYLESLGLSPWRISLLVSVLPIMRSVAPFFWGWLSDRSGRRVGIVRGTAFASLLAFSGLVMSSTFTGLVLATMALSFFWCAALPLMEALTLEHLSGGTAHYGRIRLWGSIGFIVAVMALGAALDWVPIGRLPEICWFMLLVVGLVSLTLKEPQRTNHATPGRALAQLLLQPHVIALFLGSFFMSAAHGPLYVFLSIHLVNLGYQKATLGLMWSIGVVAEILVFLTMRPLMTAFTLRTLILASMAVAVLRFMLLGWTADQPLVLFLAQVMHGATFGAYHAATVALLREWFPTAQQGQAQAIHGSVSFGAGSVAGGLLAGAAWEAWGGAITFSLGSALALAGFVLVWQGVGTQVAGHHR